MHLVIAKAEDLSSARLSADAGRETTLHRSSAPALQIAVEGRFHVAARGAARREEAELLAELYRERGLRALDAVDGAFAFAIVDQQARVAHIGVDKLGQSQLYLAETETECMFATSLSELLGLMSTTPELDVASVFDFLSLGWVPSPHSMFKGIAKLEPGSLVTWDGSSLSRTTYYDVPHTAAFTSRTTDTLSREVLEHLHSSVERGVSWSDSWSSFLSGGLDSSGVVYALRNAIEEPFSTYYGSFGNLERYMALPDEAQVAQRVGDTFGTRHNVVLMEADVIDRVPELVRAIEEPFCDGGPIVVDGVMQAAKSEANGIMTGNGGDFLFGGERRHLLISVLAHTRHLPIWGLASLISRLPLPASEKLTRMRFDLQRTASIRDLPLGEFYARRLHGSGLADDLIHPDLVGQLRSPLEQIDVCLARAGDLDDLTKLLYLDLRMLTPDLLMRDVHALGREHELVVYSPYLEAAFVDFAMTIPPDQKVHRLKMKYAMRQAFRGRLPEEVLGKKKGGLGAPIRWWVTNAPLVAEHLSREVVEARGLFKFAEISRMLDDTQTGRRDYSTLLWSLFTLESWMRQFIDSGHGARAPIAASGRHVRTP